MRAGTPVTELKGVGPALALKLEKLGLYQLQDLLFHLPLRYQDRTRVTPIGSLRPNDEVTVIGEVKLCDVVMGRRRALLCKIQDGTGTIGLRFFHFSMAQKRGLAPGTRIICFGEARPGAAGLEMVHPEYRAVRDDQPVLMSETLTPVYPATEGLQQPRIRTLVAQALQLLTDQSLVELLPSGVRARYQLPELGQAIRYLHQPPPDADLYQLQKGQHPAQRRLALEELLAHHLSLLKLRQQARQQGAPQLVSDDQLEQAFLATLPFQPTGAQRRVADEVAEDLAKAEPMLRLVQGDVGSGKTLVAALAVLRAVACGKQAAVMAPTEILAEQHQRNFTSWLEPLGISVGWLVGKLKGKARAREMARIESGEAQVVVGTHALFQDEVKFADLALVVIDEQHRFGVHQRLSLREKGRNGEQIPHQLIMTATPIPRTLTMSAYADLDCSVIDELPPGRTPVNTVVIADSRRDQVVDRVSRACAEGRQVYWVCTLIEESEQLQCQAAEVTAEQLKESLPDLRIGLVHGRMKPKEKGAVMDAFKAAELDLLVATTVIEVGVDVPNASVMIIENPERLGLAQLHQLRGRVGRGSVESHCVLMYQAPLSRQGRERLQVMRETTDGFVIAEKDLELRGPGEVLGTRQTGVMQFRIADLERDADLLETVRELVPEVTSVPAHVDLMIERWLGSSAEYGGV